MKERTQWRGDCGEHQYWNGDGWWWWLGKLHKGRGSRSHSLSPHHTKSPRKSSPPSLKIPSVPSHHPFHNNPHNPAAESSQQHSIHSFPWCFIVVIVGNRDYINIPIFGWSQKEKEKKEEQFKILRSK
jgi:hypothetical protein